MRRKTRSYFLRLASSWCVLLIFFFKLSSSQRNDWTFVCTSVADISEKCNFSLYRCPVAIMHQLKWITLPSFVCFLLTPRTILYSINQFHKTNGNQHFSAIILFTGGCQREMACIVYKALLLLCFNKYLQGSDKEKSAVSASQQKYHWQQWTLSWGTSSVETSLLSIIW